MDNPHNDQVLREHAMAALIGLAIGDALGMPTESMSRTQIAQAYGPITRPRDAVDWQPIAPAMPAGSVTDDTEQAMLLAKLLIEGRGVIEPMAFALALSQWEADMEAKGSLDLLGPSTKAAIAAIRAGATPEDDPGAGGSTNGAAMRVTPVGIAFSLVSTVEPARSTHKSSLDSNTVGGGLMKAVLESARLTHNTGLGLGAAGVVAAAVSDALDRPGQSLSDTIAHAVEAATPLAQSGNWVAGGSVPARVAWAVDSVADLPEADTLDAIDQIIGTSVASQESIPAAFALASRFVDDPYHALCLAAEVGGDTDTMAAIAGAILGAHHGMSAWPVQIVDQVVTVNHLDLDPVVDGLVNLRRHR
ncbi:MAG: ADP-ribosylglycohydrolase family protein [Propionibacteriaceae bacterium]|jgi:ADP-ribosylglycohydrolase|nr:ADP-ribosylglycohydrolase family protein [Propionibacteriaceae bacterium]